MKFQDIIIIAILICFTISIFYLGETLKQKDRQIDTLERELDYATNTVISTNIKNLYITPNREPFVGVIRVMECTVVDNLSNYIDTFIDAHSNYMLSSLYIEKGVVVLNFGTTNHSISEKFVIK